MHRLLFSFWLLILGVFIALPVRAQMPVPDDEFAHLCTSGTAEEIRQAIQEGANVNARNKYGQTALMRAVLKNSPGVVRILIDAGADLDVTMDTCGWTALMRASDDFKPEKLAMLIHAGADVNTADKKGQTALLAAADRGSLEAVQMLLDADADVNAQNSHGLTALMWAANERNPRSVTALLHSGGSVNIRDAAGQTALDYAEEEGNTKAAGILREAGERLLSSGEACARRRVFMKPDMELLRCGAFAI